MLKLVPFSILLWHFPADRKIEQFARENEPAGWLIADQIPSYRTICRLSEFLMNWPLLTTDKLITANPISSSKWHD
ncbi:hypothetical protein [Lactiplantibacillus plantarum]|uniref:hypothetical protein n=1 Tax=Lactiplantibacillus plantarum TaxID=1590 RepID=UPI003B9E8423